MGMRVIKGFLAAALLLGSYAANAVPWYWDDWHADLVKVDGSHPYEYNHNITDGPNGFRAGVDHVNYGLLSILVSDDAIGGDLPAWLLGDGQETAGFRFDGGSWQVVYNPEVNYLTVFDFVVTSLLQDGYLHVKIRANRGDFLFGISHLEAWGDRAVPEPAILSMFGLGLLGLGFFARRRRA
jgi:PEP-CTERM motif